MVTGKLKNIPQDGGATLTGLDAAPDVPGVFDVPLIIDTKPMVADAPIGSPEVAAAPDGGGVCSVDAGALTLSGTIAADRILAYLPGCVYKATSNITVAKTAALTVEPGVRVEFAQGVSLEVDGGLHAVGTAALPIVFTGAQPTAGYWDGIYFYYTIDNRNVFDYVTVEYAGNTAMLSSIQSNVALNNSSVQITHSTLRYGKGFGLALSSSTLLGTAGFAGNTLTLNGLGAASLVGDVVGQLTGAGSTFSGNSKDIVVVAAHTVTTAQTWPALDAQYLVNGTVDVSGALAIAAGAKFRFATDGEIVVSSDGSLSARGAAGKQITFVGDQGTPGYWSGLQFYYSNSVDNVLDYVVVENAGTAAYSSSDPVSSIEVNHSRIKVTNTIARNGSGHGITLNAATVDAFSGNTFTLNTLGAANVGANQVALLTGAGNTFANNTANFIVVRGETVSAPQTWPALDAPYQITADTTITTDLVIAAGANLVFKTTTRLLIESPGSLAAIGTAAAPIVFTCEKQIAGCWDGVTWYVTSNPSSQLDYVTVSYGGATSYSTSLETANIAVYNSKLSITHSTISYSSNYGIFWYADAATVVTQSGNTFVGNVTDTP